MTKILNKYSFHYLLTVTLIILILLLSFLPILPIWTYAGIDERHRVINILKYHAYYEGFNIYSKPLSPLDFLYTISFFGTYIMLGIPLVVIVIQKYFIAKISLLIDSIFFFVVSISDSKVSSFAFIGFVVTLFLVVLNILLDYQIKKNSPNVSDNKKIDEIGIIIKNKRKELHLTQQDLSNSTNISRSLIAKIETGAIVPTKRQIDIISNALNINVLKDEKIDVNKEE